MSLYGGSQQQQQPQMQMGANGMPDMQAMVQNLPAQQQDQLKQMMAMMSGTKPVDPSNPGKPMKPDSASMMMPLLMMPLVMGMGGGQGAERRAWAQPPRW